MAREFGDYLFGQFRQKRQVIFGIDDQRRARPARKFVEIDLRADGAPDLAQVVELNRSFETLANVASGLPVPHDVGNVGRSMVECGYADAGIMGGGDERIA